MRRTPLIVTAALILTCCIHLPSLAGGRHDRQNGRGQGVPTCLATAWQAMTACRLDTEEEFHLTRANCGNISSRSERRACEREALRTQREEARICIDQLGARITTCGTLRENRYDPDPLLDPAIAFIDPGEIGDVYDPNPYFSLAAGHTYVLQAGEEGEETVVVHVTDESREIHGVSCRIVLDLVFEVEVDEETSEVEYELVEFTDDWYAQDEDGNIYYCGELSRNFEDGVLRDLDGSFEAGLEYAKSGLLLRAMPVPGDADRQEFSLGEAEDIVQYVDLAAIPAEGLGGDNESFPCAPDGCLQTRDSSPLEPNNHEFKFYIPGTGFVLAVAFEDGRPSGEREELRCSGDGLETLADEACGIAELDTVLETLCELSPLLCPAEE